MMRLMDANLAAGVKITNVAQWCRVNGVDRRTFYRHRARIEGEGSWQPRSRRPKTSPGRTPAEVTGRIVRLRGELAPDNGADTILAELRQIAARDGWEQRGLRVPHRSTVNKILTREGLVTPQPGKRPKSSWRRFAYARPRDCYQLDATEVKLAGGQAVVIFDVLDDCTRLLAACQAADAETAAAAVTAITAAAQACGAPGIVLRDNGAAFGGGIARGQGAFVRAVAAMNSRLIRSAPYHPQTCGKVERHHQTLKKWLATRPVPATLPALQELLGPPRAFRTADLELSHAARCRFRYSAWTSCGVLYPSAEWRRVRLYRSSMYRAISSRAFFRVGYTVRWTRSTFSDALNDSASALSKHDPVRPTDWRIPSPSRAAANSAEV